MTAMAGNLITKSLLRHDDVDDDGCEPTENDDGCEPTENKSLVVVGSSVAETTAPRTEGQPSLRKRRTDAASTITAPPMKKHMKHKKPTESKNYFKSNKAPFDDGMLNCMLENNQCIPVWPQYVVKDSKTRYIKVAHGEAWLTAYCSALRKNRRRGCEPAGLHNTKTTKELTKDCCQQLLLEFREVLAETKAQYKKEFDGEFPQEATVSYNGFDVLTATNGRQLMLHVDTATMKWIRGAFTETFTNIVRAGGRTSAGSQVGSIGRIDNAFRYSSKSIDVGDKVTWNPGRIHWCLSGKFTGMPIKAYCERESFCLGVPASLTGEEFDNARDAALLHACMAWNECDMSKKPRIQLPANSVKTEVEHHGRAESDSESDRESDSENSGSGSEPTEDEV